ncbi:MAG: hypothetical protein KIT84_12355 [Labilithrix sp.]|nr:hypothetical protein [Labilithrix sp.]MCW5811805.1 hypothetical protein [Labilithrix sp.]
MCREELTLREWFALPFVGFQHDGCGGWLELRNHHCMTTISREVTSESLRRALDRTLR